MHICVAPSSKRFSTRRVIFKILRIKFGGESSKNLSKPMNYIPRKMYIYNYRQIISGYFSETPRGPSKEPPRANESQDRRAPCCTVSPEGGETLPSLVHLHPGTGLSTAHGCSKHFHVELCRMGTCIFGDLKKKENILLKVYHAIKPHWIW